MFPSQKNIISKNKKLLRIHNHNKVKKLETWERRTFVLGPFLPYQTDDSFYSNLTELLVTS